MRQRYIVQVGTLGRIGRFAAVDGFNYTHGTRVICRTSRGLEVGRVLAPDESSGEVDGDLLRRVAVEDELLLARLERHKHEAFEACASLLEERGLSAILVDVEPLFDGGSLYFYFLDDVSPEVEAITQDLAAAYDAKAKLTQFADTLTAGCGPDCGTENASGCSTGGCTGCAVASACKTHH